MNDDAAGALVLLGICLATLLGAVGLPALLVVVRARRRMAVAAELARRWPELAKVVNGTYDRGALTGEYVGFPMEATITRTRPMERGSPALHYHQLTLWAAVSGRGRDWELHKIGENGSGAEQAAWRVESEDAWLRRQLADSGAIDIVRQTPGLVSVLYRAEQGALISLAPVVAAAAVPEPEGFTMQLDTLARLGKINGKVNGG